MKFPILLLAFAGIFVLYGHAEAQLACVETTDGLRAMHSARVVIVNDNGMEVPLDVLVANDNFERASGFQYICPSVIHSTLILFQYAKEIFARFHMNNVHAPLDIAFFKGSGKLAKVLLMQTYSNGKKPLYGPGEPFRFALEARQGFFVSHHISSSKSYLKISD